MIRQAYNVSWFHPIDLAGTVAGPDALVNAYRDAPRKRDDDEEEELRRSDSRTIDAIARDHRQRTDDEYRRNDERLRNAYRGQR